MDATAVVGRGEVLVIVIELVQGWRIGFWHVAITKVGGGCKERKTRRREKNK